MLVHEFLASSAKKSPGKIALVTARGQSTYEQLDQESDAFAASLLQGGLVKGDRVGIYLGNCRETVVALFGALKAGGVFVVINPTTKRDKLLYILNNARCQALVASGNLVSKDVGNLCGGVPSLKQVYLVGTGPVPPPAISFEESIKMQKKMQLPPVIDVDLAALIYTSGSTGFPKGVVMTHLNMISAATSITTYLENTPDDVILNVLPLSFDYGLYQVLMAFLFRGTVILEESFNYPFQIVTKLKEFHVTGFPGVPTIFAMLSKLDKIREMDFPALRYVTNTGAALHAAYIESIRKMFPGAKLFSMYGLTECKRVAYLPPEELEHRVGSVGKAMPNVEVQVLRDDGTPAGPHEPGELVIRGSNVMQGYWEDAEATKRVLRQGRNPWEKVLHSGDVFRTDEDGFLYFIGRKDDIIKTRGEKVSPKEVENVICGMPGVQEAAVVGIVDEVLGQAIRAFVVRDGKKPLVEKDVIKYCVDHLESFMVPKSVVFLDAFPKNPSGKIDKKMLPDLASPVSPPGESQK